MDHPIAHPRNAAFLGLMFVALSLIYLWLSHDSAGATMIFALGIAMGLAAYSLAVGSPRG